MRPARRSWLCHRFRMGFLPPIIQRVGGDSEIKNESSSGFKLPDKRTRLVCHALPCSVIKSKGASTPCRTPLALCRRCKVLPFHLTELAACTTREPPRTAASRPGGGPAGHAVRQGRIVWIRPPAQSRSRYSPAPGRGPRPRRSPGGSRH